jgi:hypothetical protein
MSVVEPGPTASKLVDRVKAILLQPSATWDVIDTEQTTIGELYKGYVIPLALIPLVCGLIGALVFGYGGFGIVYKPPLQWALAGVISRFVVTLVGVYILALVIDALAPNFGGTRNQVQAFKVAAYSGTASWVAGVFLILPALAILSLLGFYSLFLLHKGLPKLMKAPEEKAMSYTVVIVIVGVVISLVASAIGDPIMRFGHNPYDLAQKAQGELKLPGGASVDLGKLEAASKQLEAAAKQVEGGSANAVKATDPEILKAYLPAEVAGFSRTELSTGSGGAAGIEGSSAEGTYSRGETSFKLTVTDMGAAGALAAMAGAFNVQSSSESDGRYEKVGKVAGRMTMEEYDRASKHGEYSVLAGDRFMVQAEGEGVDIGVLKSAVGAVGLDRLEALAKKG